MSEELRVLLDKLGIEWTLPNPCMNQDQITTQVGHCFITETFLMFRTGTGHFVKTPAFLIENMAAVPVVVDGSYEWWAIALSPAQAVGILMMQTIEAVAEQDGAELEYETAKRIRAIAERGTIGHTECSACHVAVGIDDCFCRHCGKELLDELP